MTVKDFDPANKALRVNESKTDAGRRTLHLDAQTATAISKHLLATGRSGLSDGALFTSPEGRKLNYANFRTRVLMPAFERAGLTGFTLHSLRRTHATMLVAGGHNAKAVQSRMGHASIQTTLSYYAVATEADKQNAAGALGDYLNSVSGTEDSRKNAG